MTGFVMSGLLSVEGMGSLPSAAAQTALRCDLAANLPRTVCINHGRARARWGQSAFDCSMELVDCCRFLAHQDLSSG